MPGEANELIVIPKKEIDEKDELVASLEAKAQKMKSEFARYKERVKDSEEAIRRTATGELARQLLSVADTLERAIEDGGGDEADYGCEVVEQMLEGTRSNIGMTYSQLLDASGMVPVAPSSGDRYDHELHTAIETTQDPLLPDKTIVSLVRKGYTLDGELIRPAEVIIARGGGEPDEHGGEAVKTEAKPETILSKFMRRLGSGTFKRQLEEADAREQKLNEREDQLIQKEETLRKSVKELDEREREFEKRLEEWTKRKGEAEPAVIELEARKEALVAELEESKGELSAIRANSTELNATKEKTVVESLALSKYNEELLEGREKLLNEVSELEGRKESLAADIYEMEARRVSREGELTRVEEKITTSGEELFRVEAEVQTIKESLNSELTELNEMKQRKESLALDVEESERQLRSIQENSDELDLKKEKILLESLALSKYNEELLEERDKLLNEIGEIKRENEPAKDEDEVDEKHVEEADTRKTPVMNVGWAW